MIWCVEDDASIRELEIYTLNSTGFAARGFADGDEMFKALDTDTPELILLDIMLPGRDGVEILRLLKSKQSTAGIPVIMATAKGMEFDKVQSLDLGADDYLVKPFGMMEMVSRIKAVLRRCKNIGENTIEIGDLTINLDSRAVTLRGNRIDLTYKEFELLCLFAKNPRRVFTREQLYEKVWGDYLVGETRTIDMHIRTLRQKIGAFGACIKTVRNVGYKLEECDYDQ